MKSLKNIAINNRLTPMIIAGLAIMISIGYLLDDTLDRVISDDLKTEIEYQKQNILKYKEQETALLRMLAGTSDINNMVRHDLKKVNNEYKVERLEKTDDSYFVEYQKIENPIERIVILNYWGKVMHSQSRARETGVEVFDESGQRVAGSLGDNRMLMTKSNDNRVEHVLGKDNSYSVKTNIQDLEVNKGKLFYKTFVGLGIGIKRDKGVVVLTSMLNNNILNSMKHGNNNNLILIDTKYQVLEDTFPNIDEFNIKLEGVNNIEKVNTMKIGSKNYRTQLMPLRNFDNEIIAYLGVVKDVTVYRELERNLKFLVLGIIILVLTITFVISIKQIEKYILIPLRKLINHMKLLRNKNYDLIKESNLPLELNDLVDNYNKMALKIREHIENISNKKEIIDKKNKELRELVIEKEKLYMRAITDGLTGLYNHSFFKKELQNEIKRSQRYERKFTLLLMDIDDFKEKNDVYGHQYGDEILRKLGILLNDESRSNDVIGRYGGEEMVVLLPETDIENGYRYGEKLRKKIKKISTKTEITVSIGLCEYDSKTCPVDKVKDIEKILIERADTAMYFAKKSGKDKVKEYKEFMK